MTTIYVRNLPAGATEEQIREALEHHAMINAIEFVDDPNASTDRKQARITVDMPHFDAEQLATRFNGRIVGGEPITLFVPLHD